MDLPYLEERIGEHGYQCYALPMDRWSILSEYLSSLCGEPVRALLEGFDVTDLQELLVGDAGALAALFAHVSKKLTAQNIQGLIAHMGPVLYIQDERGAWESLDAKVQNLHWAHYRGEFSGVVWLFLRSQYADFFSGFAGWMPTRASSEKSLSVKASLEGAPSQTT